MALSRGRAWPHHQFQRHDETRARAFRRSYYAAITYTDYNIGIVLDKLDALGLAESTAVVGFFYLPLHFVRILLTI